MNLLLGGSAAAPASEEIQASEPVDNAENRGAPSLLRRLLGRKSRLAAALIIFALLVVGEALTRPWARGEFPLLDHLTVTDAFRAMINQGRFVLLCLSGLLIADRFPITDRPRRHLLLAFLWSLLAVVVVQHIVWGVSYVAPLGAPPRTLAEMITRGGSALHVAFIFVIAGYAVQLVERSASRQSEALRLESDLIAAQLSSLTMQLRPHFLFNALHSVSVLMEEDPALAEKVLLRLRELLDATLRTHHPLVSLAEEIDFICLYTSIEQVRFSDRLEVHFSIDPAVRLARVPHLLLQPLVENAIRHGISRKAGKGWIQINAWKDRERLRLEVRDSGPGLGADWTLTGVGVGLSNTITRLDHLYGSRYHFDLLSPPEGGTVAALSLPLVVSSAEDRVETTSGRRA